MLLLVGTGSLLIGAFHTYYIVSGSMEPTFRINDSVLVSRLSYVNSVPMEGDIVAFRPPIVAPNRFMKRIIAHSGETLRIHDRRVYRNGVALNESYVAEPTHYELEIKNYGIYVDGVPLDSKDANVPPRPQWTAPNVVPPGCSVLLGDKRNDSEDSHIWGGFAQRDERFYSGPEAGEEAGNFERAIRILFPAARAGDLK